MPQDINVGIGFATGRKSFQKVLKTNIYNWRECGLTDQARINLHLFVAYDLTYANTKSTDYTEISKTLLNLIDGAHFIGGSLIRQEIEHLLAGGVLTEAETRLFFSGGYASKRNAILHQAVKKKMDYLIFFDDDEYPLAVTKNRSTALWSGQNVLGTHLRNIGRADVTNGLHCGYISPIPSLDFNDILTENDFRLFIEAISNDIINWDKLKSIMENGGVTYANADTLVSEAALEVDEVKGAKFISGANLCLNLTRPERIFPFYNPPKARGEDTFLSTCLTDRRVLRLPCYTFHDAFSFYKPLMDGVLPIKLRHIKADSEAVVNRFYSAAMGWVRYKPLLIYITQPDKYEEAMSLMEENLALTLPKISAYFAKPEFLNISEELAHYHRNVKKHFRDFQATISIWAKIQQHIAPFVDSSLVGGDFFTS